MNLIAILAHKDESFEWHCCSLIKLFSSSAFSHPPFSIGFLICMLFFSFLDSADYIVCLTSLLATDVGTRPRSPLKICFRIFLYNWIQIAPISKLYVHHLTYVQAENYNKGYLNCCGRLSKRAKEVRYKNTMYKF